MIKLFNKLNSIQSVKIQDRFKKVYTIFIESRKSTEIEDYQITEDVRNKINSGTLIDLTNSKDTGPISTLKVYDIVSETIKENSEPALSSESKDSTETIEDEEKEVELNEEETTTNILKLEDSNGPFICDICGNEYASNRGLEMHKSKTHK